MYRSGGGAVLHRVDFPLVLSMLLEVASALLYLHNGGFIHCDLKPENILLKVC